MGKFYGGLLFFLVAVALNYFFNLPNVEGLAQTYLTYDSFVGAYVIAAFQLLFYPLNSIGILLSWLIAGFLGGLLCRTWKSALLVSILMGFILSLTWLFLLSRYLPNYWNYFISMYTTLELLGQSLGMGLLLGASSAGPAVLGAYLTNPHKKIFEKEPLTEIQCVCPHCGTIFQSKPKFCYNCNGLITEVTDNSNRQDEE